MSVKPSLAALSDIEITPDFPQLNILNDSFLHSRLKLKQSESAAHCHSETKPVLRAKNDKYLS